MTWKSVAVVVSLGLAVMACGGATPAIGPVIAPDSQRLARAFAGGDVEQVILDESGSYFCVLRRSDHLAELRARYSGS